MKIMWKRRDRQGAVLVEFAVAVFVFLALAFGALELMRAFLVAQVAAEAARIGARQAAVDPTVVEAADLFDPDYSVIDLDAVGDLDELFRRLPPMHTALRPIMIRDDRDGRRLLRLPGALFEDPSAPSGYRVQIPVLESEGPPVRLRYAPAVELDPDDGAGNVRVTVRCHNPFAVLLSADPSERGLYVRRARPSIDDTIDPADSGVVDPGLRPPGLRGRLRNAFATIEVHAVSRREFPLPTAP